MVGITTLNFPMKTKLLLLLLGLCSTVVPGDAEINEQADSNALIGPNSSWSVLRYGLGSYNIPCCVSTRYLYFEGDSIVAGNTYKKVFSCNGELHENITYEGLIREEDKKIYFLAKSLENEHLLYDFSLEEGMTFEYSSYMDTELPPVSLYVKTSDMIEINGYPRKRLQLSFPQSEDGWIIDTWIEGIGSLSGILQPCYCLFQNGAVTELLCHYKNDELIYKNPARSGCYYDREEDIRYIPMLVQKNQWNELVKNISLSPEYQYERTYITKLGGITDVGGVSYYELKTTRVETADVWETVGYIREDVEQQKVYYKPLEQAEILLYAFDVQAGDVLQSHDIFFREPVEVTVRVDSIKTIRIDNMQRKQIYVTANGTGDYSTSPCNRVWIEGIGNTDGFLQSTRMLPPPGSLQYTLQCFFNDDQLIYKNSETGIEDCFVWRYPYTGIIEPETGKDYIVSQTNNTLSIAAQNPILSTVELFDTAGKKIYEKHFNPPCYQQAIETGGWIKSLYLLRIVDTNGDISLFKIITR